MKLALRLALAPVVAALLVIPLRAADAPPPVSIQKAVELAQQALVAKGVEKEVYIASVGLKRATMTGPRDMWEVTWSSSVPATLPGSREVGLEISMKGEVVHIVKGNAAK